MSRQKNKVISDTSGDEDKKTRSKSKHSEKKSLKKESRHANSSSFDSESDMPSKSNRKTKKSQIGGYIDEEKATEYEGDMNSHHSHTRRKRDRKQKKSSRSVVDGDEEAQTAPNSSSNMGGSTMTSKKHKGRGRNNGQFPMHSENHYDDGFVGYDHPDYMSEMGNHDPIDDYGEDYDMSDDDEEEPRLAEHANGDIRCALILSVTCISIAVACLVIFREEFLDWVVFGLLGMGP
eukprot:CAMPEP_0116118710 /NCGR_PEP_ID=MMETSP0329-20121206/2252_1 /TAXON_ID=697910 /ORGANISM="Pseudo-nitzschia arenysensis, Strain B593" /LENGTH=233 /DNA_ID=CAMNT_0003612361 /DNA_START=114 /DNA_END=815 /DNA_ORIENTATION=-